MQKPYEGKVIKKFFLASETSPQFPMESLTKLAAHMEKEFPCLGYADYKGQKTVKNHMNFIFYVLVVISLTVGYVLKDLRICFNIFFAGTLLNLNYTIFFNPYMRLMKVAWQDFSPNHQISK